jgi:O-acetyl-ADP-ribose deacetylase (regulator of RNase III)
MAPDVSAALARAFADRPDVRVRKDDILALARGAVVSPANGYGYMDGGRGSRLRRGPALESRVLEAIDRAGGAPLPVGASLLVSTGHATIPWLIVAPTMILPEPVDPTHAYRAFRAVLRLAAREPERLATIFCPGLATGVGGVSPTEAATQMKRAFDDWVASSRG